MKTKKQKEVVKQRIAYPVYISSFILILMAVWALVMNMSGVFVADYPSIVRFISAAFIIIGSIGIFRLARWGLYFLAASIIFPSAFFLYYDRDAFLTMTGMVDLIIFAYLFCLCQAHYCRDPEAQSKWMRISKTYISFASVVLASVALAVFFAVLSCALGNTRAGFLTELFGLSAAAEWLKDAVAK